MEVGQVSFKDPRKVKRVLVAQRENPIVNRLNKTKVERKPDLKQERDDRLKELRQKTQAAQQQRVKAPPTSFLVLGSPFTTVPCFDAVRTIPLS